MIHIGKRIYDNLVIRKLWSKTKKNAYAKYIFDQITTKTKINDEAKLKVII